MAVGACFGVAPCATRLFRFLSRATASWSLLLYVLFREKSFFFSFFFSEWSSRRVYRIGSKGRVQARGNQQRQKVIADVSCSECNNYRRSLSFFSSSFFDVTCPPRTTDNEYCPWPARPLGRPPCFCFSRPLCARNRATGDQPPLSVLAIPHPSDRAWSNGPPDNTVRHACNTKTFAERVRRRYSSDEFPPFYLSLPLSLFISSLSPSFVLLLRFIACW